MPLRSLAVLAALLSLSLATVRAEDKVTHKVLVAAKGRVALLNEKGAVDWEVANSFGGVHDLTLLPNGNVLFPNAADTIVEMTPDKKIVWQYQSKPKEGYKGPVEVHAFQRLDDGRTMIAESGNRRIIEVDREGKIFKEVPLTIGKPSAHRDTRLVRKLDSGNYLVCQEGDGKVVEYDPSGKVVWSYALDLGGRERTPNHDGHGTEVYGAVRLANGNTLIAGGNNNRVLEVNPKGEIVWSINHDELPGIRLYWVTALHVLPNGNIVVGNCHAGPDNPQLIEVTRDKKVVWTFKDFKAVGNDMAAAQVVGVMGKVLR